MYYNNDVPREPDRANKVELFQCQIRTARYIWETFIAVNFQLAKNKIDLTIQAVEWQRRARSKRFFKSRNSKYSELRGLGHNTFAKNTE